VVEVVDVLALAGGFDVEDAAGVDEAVEVDPCARGALGAARATAGKRATPRAATAEPTVVTASHRARSGGLTSVVGRRVVQVRIHLGEALVERAELGVEVD